MVRAGNQHEPLRARRAVSVQVESYFIVRFEGQVLTWARQSPPSMACQAPWGSLC